MKKTDDHAAPPVVDMAQQELHQDGNVDLHLQEAKQRTRDSEKLLQAVRAKTSNLMKEPSVLTRSNLLSPSRKEPADDDYSEFSDAAIEVHGNMR